MALVAVPLSLGHAVLTQNFECEYPYITDYLRDPLRAYEDRKTGDTKTVLVIDEDNNRIAA